MKTSTIISKMYAQYKSGNMDFDILIEGLKEACHLAIIKERKAIIRKVAKAYNEDEEFVEKKILQKKNRHITEEKIKLYSDMFSKQPTTYKKLLVNDEEYMAEIKKYGLIYKVTDKKAKIVGYISKTNRPIFIKQK